MATTRFFIMHFLLWGLPLFSAALSIPRRRSDYSGVDLGSLVDMDRVGKSDEHEAGADAEANKIGLRRAAAIVGYVV